jgi:hypothetical protein
MTAVSRDTARPGENLRIRILRANPAYSNNWYWTSVTVVMNSTIQLQILSSYNSHLCTSRSTRNISPVVFHRIPMQRPNQTLERPVFTMRAT